MSSPLAGLPPRYLRTPDAVNRAGFVGGSNRTLDRPAAQVE
jgi:hypothetical protein